jgi:hypothetical protein
MTAPGPIVKALEAWRRALRWWRRLTVRQVFIASTAAVLAALLLKAALPDRQTDPANLVASNEDVEFSRLRLVAHAILKDQEQQLARALRLLALSDQEIAAVADGRGWDMGRVLSLTGSTDLPATREARLQKLTEATETARKDEPRLRQVAHEQRQWTSLLDRQLELLKDASVAFNAPQYVTLAKSISIEAKIHPTLPAKELVATVDGAGQVESGSLKVSDRMAATLTGGSAFDISGCSPTEQPVPDRESTSWCWVITPKIGGRQVLVLSFDAVLELAGKDNKRSVKTFTRHINVDVSWPQTWNEWLELAKKTGENLSYLWAGLLVPVGATVWALLSKGRRASNAVVPKVPSKKRRSR